MSSSTSTFNLGKFIIQLALIAIALGAIHTYVIHRSFPSLEFYFETWEIYGFQFVTVAAVVYFLNRVNESKPSNVLSTYLILTMAKMGLALLFLLPLFLDKSLPAKPSVFSFFIAFFLFLFIETKIVLKILNPKK